MSSAQPALGATVSRPASGWIRWGIPAMWLGWVALYVAGALVRDGVPQQLEVLRWLAPALVVLMTLRLAWASTRWAQVRDAGDALVIVQHGRSQRVDLAELRSVDAAWLIPPRRMALRFHGTRADVVFLPAHGQEHDQLVTTLLARANARRGVEKETR